MIGHNDAVGVLAMRIQVDELHEGHKHLVHIAHDHCADTFIALGFHGGLRTDRDPLTFEERRAMILETFPASMNIQIELLRDHPFSHERWCNWLDDLVASKYGNRPAVMIGSRDSFLGVYKKFGKHKTLFVEPVSDVSGSARRAAIVHSPAMSARQAIIHNELHRPAIAYSATDIAIVNDVRQEVLGIVKNWFDGLWSLPGGFVDPERDENDESAARRERGEELPMIKTPEAYSQLGPRIRVEDPRYRKSKDKIYSSLFVTRYRGGDLTPGDDAKGARWFGRDELKSMFVPWHQPLLDRIIARWDDQRK